jgi:hypothetical protein
MIDPKAVKFIHTAVSRLLLNDQDYRTLLKERYGASTCKALTRAQGDDLVHYFKSLGFGKEPKRKFNCWYCTPRPRDTRPIPEGVIYPVSSAQLAVIDELSKAVKWNDPAGFAKWLLKYFSISKIEWSPQASAVIVGLKGLLRSRKQKCSGCPFVGQLKGDIDARSEG